MKILLINGPNLNMLGKRNNAHYGSKTLAEIIDMVEKEAEKESVNVFSFQSNHEGALIDFIQKQAASSQGIIINPGALTHYGFSLRDAVVDTNLPTVEIHLSDIENREEFRKIDVFNGVVLKRITGLKEQSYIEGVRFLLAHLNKNI